MAFCGTQTVPLSHGNDPSGHGPKIRNEKQRNEREQKIIICKNTFNLKFFCYKIKLNEINSDNHKLVTPNQIEFI